MKQNYLKCLLLGILSLVGIKAGAYDCKVDGIYYNLDKSAKTASVTYYNSSNYSSSYSGVIKIPSSITYSGTIYDVTSIGSNAFRDCSGLDYVSIPYSVTSIGNSAFANCSGLDYVSIPYSVTSIGNSAFANCSGLTSVTIPNSVTSIGRYAFQGCSGLTSVTIPSSVTSIGDCAYSGCTGLTSVNFNATNCIIMGSLSYPVFKGCGSFTTLEIGVNVKNIPDYAFYGCSGLTSETILYSVTSIGSSAFYGCSGLTSVTIPNSVTSIGSSAFYGCKGLTSVTIPNSVTSIGSCAFEGCKGLTSVTIPNSVTNIGNSAFYGCSSLKKVIVKDIAAWCKINFSSSTSNPLYYAHHLFSNEYTEITKLIIPNNVTTIGRYTFDGCSGLTSIAIPSSVTSIGEYFYGNAFTGCSGLNSIIVDDGNPVYDSRNNCNAIIETATNELITGCRNTKIPNNVEIIGWAAFEDCVGLTSVTIPNSVTGIGTDAFSGCTGLTEVTINSDFIVSSGNGTSFSTVFGNQVKSYVIGNSVTSIGRYKFKDCSRLTSITIPNSVTTIGYCTFKGCSGLTSITIPNSVKSMGLGIFEGCSHLTSVTISNSLTYIPESAFYECIGLTSITIPNSVTGIGVNAFRYCSGLTSVNIPSSVIGIGDWAFDGCSGLISSTTSTSISTGIYLEAGSSLSFTLTNYNSVSVVDNGYVKFTGLEPMQIYKIDKIGLSGTTKKLTFTTSQPKVISAGNVIVAAESNLDDEETNVGFEWRRTDWSSDFASNQGNAYLYNGTMEGYIRNLYTEKLWKFRPYYTSNAGNTYYGEWVGIDPTNTSYFEPTVHTYANISVNGNSAEVKGYAMRGTDNVTSQGFAYWVQSSNVKERGDEKAAPAMAQSIPSNAKIVEASGQVMTATLSGLNYGTTYCYVAFVKTSEGETFYGEQQSFSTGEDPSGIDGVVMDASDAMPVTVVARYNMNGQQISTPQPGVNILRMSDGTVRKVLVK